MPLELSFREDAVDQPTQFAVFWRRMLDRRTVDPKFYDTLRRRAAHEYDRTAEQVPVVLIRRHDRVPLAAPIRLKAVACQSPPPESMKTNSGRLLPERVSGYYPSPPPSARKYSLRQFLLPTDIEESYSPAAVSRCKWHQNFSTMCICDK